MHARHARLARAVHAAVDAWGEGGALRVFTRRGRSALGLGDGDRGRRRASTPRRCEPSRASASRSRSPAASARSHGRAFRIGHLGDMNEAMLLGCLAGVQAAMQAEGIACGAARRRRGDRDARRLIPRSRGRRRSLLTAASSVDPLSGCRAFAVRWRQVSARTWRARRGSTTTSARHLMNYKPLLGLAAAAVCSQAAAQITFYEARRLPRPHLRDQPVGLELQARRLQRHAPRRWSSSAAAGKSATTASSAAAASCCAAAATTR